MQRRTIDGWVLVLDKPSSFSTKTGVIGIDNDGPYWVSDDIRNAHFFPTKLSAETFAKPYPELRASRARMALALEVAE